MTNIPVRERKIEKQLLNIKEICLYLGIGQTKARELVRGNNGFGVQIGNRWYANKKELDRWLEKIRHKYRGFKQINRTCGIVKYG